MKYDVLNISPTERNRNEYVLVEALLFICGNLWRAIGKQNSYGFTA